MPCRPSGMAGSEHFGRVVVVRHIRGVAVTAILGYSNSRHE